MSRVAPQNKAVFVELSRCHGSKGVRSITINCRQDAAVTGTLEGTAKTRVGCGGCGKKPGFDGFERVKTETKWGQSSDREREAFAEASGLPIRP